MSRSRGGTNYAACCPFTTKRRPPSRSAGEAVLPLLRLRRPRHRHRFLMEYAGKSFPTRSRTRREAGLDVPARGAPGRGPAPRPHPRPRRAAAHRPRSSTRAAEGRPPRAIGLLKARASPARSPPTSALLRPGRLAAARRRVSPLRRARRSRSGPGDRRRRRQALRPLSRPHHVPHPRQPRPGDRFGAGCWAPASPSTSTRRRPRCSPRAASSTASTRPQRHPRGGPGRRRRGLHGRRRARPARHRLRRRDAGHGHHAGPRAQLLPAHRLGRLLLRRRQPRAQAGVAVPWKTRFRCSPTARTRSSCSSRRRRSRRLRPQARPGRLRGADRAGDAALVFLLRELAALHPPTPPRAGRRWWRRRGAFRRAQRPGATAVLRRELAALSRAAGSGAARAAAGPSATAPAPASPRGEPHPRAAGSAPGAAVVRRAPSLVRELIQGLLLQPEAARTLTIRSRTTRRPKGGLARWSGLPVGDGTLSTPGTMQHFAGTAHERSSWRAGGGPRPRRHPRARRIALAAGVRPVLAPCPAQRTRRRGRRRDRGHRAATAELPAEETERLRQLEMVRRALPRAGSGRTPDGGS